METQQAVLCPSARCKEGVLVLGIVLPNNTIAYADRRMKIDAAEAEAMRSGAVSPEKRFRFSTPCAQRGCLQWREEASGGKCSLIEEVMAAPPSASLPRVLPRCSIRAQCRWFLQRGDEACGICRYVITDHAVLTEEEAAALAA